MALTTPVLYGVAAFDASNAQIFRFNVIGGDQVTGATLTIRDNTTLSIVKTVTQTSFEFAITLPANSLTNGGYYQATITTRNAQGISSVPSAPIQFYCYSTPIFVFTNIREGGVVGNSNYSFSVQYNQIQNEGIASYNFKLYSVGGALLQESGTVYNTIGTLPLTLSYTFSGFENNAAYSIEATGTTNEGTEISTGRVGFLVSYVAPEAFSLIALSNNCQGGYITIKSNLTDIEGESNPETPTYIYNEEIDLRADGHYVKWDKNYTIPTNWTSRLWGRNFTSGKNILEMTNESEDLLSVKYVLDNSTAKTREKIEYTFADEIGLEGSFESGEYFIPTEDRSYLVGSTVAKFGNASLVWILKPDRNVTSYTLQTRTGICKYPYVVGHKYYISLWVWQTAARGEGNMYWGNTTMPVIASISPTTFRNWVQFSTIVENHIPLDGEYPATIVYSASEIDPALEYQMRIDGVMIVDLTATFGVGNEPDKDWCDANLEYTYTINTTQWWNIPASATTIGDGHFELRALNAGDTWAYTVESNEFPVHTEDDKLFCWIRKVGDLYNIEAENLSYEEVGGA